MNTSNPQKNQYGSQGMSKDDLEFKGTLLHKKWKPEVLRQASERTVDSQAVLRWGPDNKGLARLLHPNDIILFGTWEITETTSSLVISAKAAKVSSFPVTQQEELEPFAAKKTQAMTGIISPTQDENDTSSRTPATFFNARRSR